jgi:hypothetical protein
MPEPYDTIARQAYEKILGKEITNVRLRDYYNSFFQESIDHYGAYQCWACFDCHRHQKATQGWGKPPSKCPQCNSKRVYEIATFQARASILDNAFTSTFSFLMQTHYKLPLVSTSGHKRTHDFEVTPDVAIEVKGSPASVTNPDSSLARLGRPGLERSDTRKKVFDNARTYRQR